MSAEYVPSDEVYERGALGVREYLQHPIFAGIKWSADTTAGVVVDYVSALIAAEVREQIAQEIREAGAEVVAAEMRRPRLNVTKMRTTQAAWFHAEQIARGKDA